MYQMSCDECIHIIMQECIPLASCYSCSGRQCILASVHADAAVSITNVMGRRQLKLCSKKYRQQIAYKRQAKVS